MAYEKEKYWKKARTPKPYSRKRVKLDTKDAVQDFAKTGKGVRKIERNSEKD